MLLGLRWRNKQQSPALRRPDTRRVELTSERSTEADLAGVRESLDLGRFRCGRSDDDQLPVNTSRSEEVDRPGRDSDRHPKRHGVAAHAKPPNALDRPLHLPGCPRCTSLMTRGVEEEQQGVPTPLDQSGPPQVRLVEQSIEHGVHRVPQDLGTHLPAARQPLGERREPGDVDEREGSFDLTMRDLG